MKHKADGLYYVNLKMLRRANACLGQRRKFEDVFGTGDVPLTLENATKAKQNDISLDWALSRIRQKGYQDNVTLVSYDDYIFFNDDDRNAPRKFMNIIAKRAKKEGKL